MTPVAQPAGPDQTAVARGNAPGDWRPTIRSADPQAKDMALRHKARVGIVQGGA